MGNREAFPTLPRSANLAAFGHIAGELRHSLSWFGPPQPLPVLGLSTRIFTSHHWQGGQASNDISGSDIRPHLRLLCSLVNQGEFYKGASGWKSSDWYDTNQGNQGKSIKIIIYTFALFPPHKYGYFDCTSSLHSLPLLPRISEKCRPWNSGHLGWMERSQILWQPPRVFRKISTKKKEISGKKLQRSVKFTFDKRKIRQFPGGVLFLNFSSGLITVGRLWSFTNPCKK